VARLIEDKRPESTISEFFEIWPSADILNRHCMGNGFDPLRSLAFGAGKSTAECQQDQEDWEVLHPQKLCLQPTKLQT
jgi:hypothetical protein